MNADRTCAWSVYTDHAPSLLPTDKWRLLTSFCNGIEIKVNDRIIMIFGYVYPFLFVAWFSSWLYGFLPSTIQLQK